MIYFSNTSKYAIISSGAPSFKDLAVIYFTDTSISDLSITLMQLVLYTTSLTNYLVRPQLVESLVNVRFHLIIYMYHVVIINYQNLWIKKILFRIKRKAKKKKQYFYTSFLYYSILLLTEKTLQIKAKTFFTPILLPFFKKIGKSMAILRFQKVIAVDE